MKTRFIILAAALVLLAAQGAAADEGQVFAGNNTNAPTWNRPIGAGPTISSNTVHYRTQRFRLTSDSTCYIVGSQEFDGYLHLYRNSFNPLSQLTNLIDGDDDGQLGVGTSNLPADLEDNASNSANSLSLTAGTYVLVTSGFSESQVGAFQNTIHCNGSVQPLHGSCGVQFAGYQRNEEICLQDRFLAVISWNTNSSSGHGIPVRTGTNDTGLFWFFSDSNWEVMLKVLNGCGLNGHYWVFAGALTNVGYTISVADNQTGPNYLVKGYSNPNGVRAQAFADTSAFPCSP